MIIFYVAAACSKKFSIKRNALWDLKKIQPTVFFFQGSSETQLARSFSWPYVEPPSKSATASNDKSSDDDAIEIETLKFVKKKIDNRT